MRIFSFLKTWINVNCVSLFFNPQKISNNICMNKNIDFINFNFRELKIVDMLEAINV